MVRSHLAPPPADAPARGPTFRWPVALVGAVALIVAGLTQPAAARSAAAQVWPPFVLVTGLLLVGMVADADGLFAAAGRLLADLAPGDGSLFVGSCLAVAVVTAVLNLDTAVVFLTPVLVHAARRRSSPDGPLVIACILMANAASLLLPGSNLTNLLVLGHLRLTGGAFVARTALPWTLSVLVTGLVVAVGAGDRGRRPGQPPPPMSDGTSGPPVRLVGPGLAAVVAAVVLVLVLPDPALPVAGIGVVAAGLLARTGGRSPRDMAGSLGVPLLVALFGVAVALGTLGRTWSGPAALLARLDAAGTTAFAAAASALINNLPAASLMAARTPPHPFALLVGLDIGPNLFVTGSLAWVLWIRAVRTAGAHPPTARAVGLGLVSAPLAMAAALGALALVGAH
jgi:arsenical pump membrane protein